MGIIGDEVVNAERWDDEDDLEQRKELVICQSSVRMSLRGESRQESQARRLARLVPADQLCEAACCRTNRAAKHKATVHSRLTTGIIQSRLSFGV